LFYFILVVGVFFCFELELSSLNRKEKEFIESHKPSHQEASVLDGFFSSLSKKLLKVFDGKDSLNSKDLKKLLEKKGVTVLSCDVDSGAASRIVFMHPKVPSYVLKIGFNSKLPKINLSRIIIADQVNFLIDNPIIGVKTVNKIEKKLYQRNGRSKELSDFNYVVLSPKITGESYDSMISSGNFFFESLEQINSDIFLLQDLLQLEENIDEGFSFKFNNVFLTSENCVSFTNTGIDENSVKFLDRLLHYKFVDFNDREKAFVQDHRASEEEEKKLDRIFGNLPPKLEAIFSLKTDLSESREEVLNLLEEAGFLVEMLHWGKSDNEYGNYNVVLEHSELQNYVIKIGFNPILIDKNISRIIYSDQINSLIDNPKLRVTTMKKLYKKIYHRPNRPEELVDSNYVVLSSKAVGTHFDMKKNAAITGKHFDDINHVIHSLQSLSKYSYEFDAQSSNIIFSNDGFCLLVDTEINMGDTRKKWMYNEFGWAKTLPMVAF
jgi:hypothetical protein